MTIQEAVPVGVWYKWVLLVATLVLTRMVAQLSNRFNREMGWFFFLAALYPLGKTIQFFEIGPGFLRWYLSDAGFVPATAVVLGGGWSQRFTLNGAMHGVVIGFTLAVVVEWMQMVATRAGHAGVARGDYADVMLYMATASVSLLLIHRSRYPRFRSLTP